MQNPQLLQPWASHMASQHAVFVKASNLSHTTSTFLLLKCPQAMNVLNISLSLADGNI